MVDLGRQGKDKPTLSHAQGELRVAKAPARVLKVVTGVGLDCSNEGCKCIISSSSCGYTRAVLSLTYYIYPGYRQQAATQARWSTYIPWVPLEFTRESI
jgi:hypothetical protein